MHTVMAPSVASAPAVPASLFSSPLSASSGGQPLPERLRRVLQQLSGYDLSDVRVHRASPWPARVGARAFVLGTDIHLSPGAEDALEHEAWHVVQQKQGRVRATGTVGFGEPRLGLAGLNDEALLEREAETMARVARILEPCGEHWPERGALRAAPILHPVVQRNTVIGQTEYSQLNALLAVVRQALAANVAHFPLAVLRSILMDLIIERRSFPDMQAALQEIAIRNVGYQAEAQMRSLMKENQRLLDDSRRAARQALAQAESDWNEDQQKPIAQRRFLDKFQYSAECEKIIKAVKNSGNCVFWGNASFFSSSKAFNQPMGRWVLDDQNEYPNRMNCWESVVFSLVRSGLVRKAYIGWSDLQGVLAERPVNADPGPPWPMLINEAIKIRDYFWSPQDGTLRYEADRMPLQANQRDIDNKHVLVPLDVTIPKGRLVIFAYGMHVAISTGRKRKIQSQRAREFFGREWGHGLLELDSSEFGGFLESALAKLETIRETTIEDLLRMDYTYLQHIIVAPFPDVPRNVRKPLTKTVRAQEHPAIEQLMQEYLAANQGSINAELAAQKKKDDDAIARLEKTMSRMGPESKAYMSNVTKLKNLRIGAERSQALIKERWEKRAFNSQAVKDALAQMNTKVAKSEGEGTINVETTVVLDVRATDLYHGLANFGVAKN